MTGYGNTPKHERNWAIWRSHFVDGEMKSALGRRHGLTITRISNILSIASRSTMHCILWPNRTPKERLRIVTTALEGVEIIFPAYGREYMRMPDGREFFFNGDRKETDQ